MSTLLHLADVREEMLCPLCQSIFTAPFSRSDINNLWTASCEVQTSLQELKQIAREGCFVCYTLLKRCKEGDNGSDEQLRVLYMLSMPETAFNSSTLSVSVNTGDDNAILASIRVWSERVEDGGNAVATKYNCMS